MFAGILYTSQYPKEKTRREYGGYIFVFVIQTNMSRL